MMNAITILSVYSIIEAGFVEADDRGWKYYFIGEANMV
jgi:hypothetical protein